MKAVGREKIVLDLSCRKKENKYFVVTNRWQTFTDVEVNAELLEKLNEYCAEFLVHGVDVEGKSSGVEMELVKVLADWGKLPITYAGGIGSMEDLKVFEKISNKKFTKIFMSGGVTKDLFLCRLIEEKTQTKIVPCMKEASVVGNLLLQLQGLNLVSSVEECQMLMKNLEE